MKKKIIFLLKILFLYQLSSSFCSADLQKNLINRLTGIQTLVFDFKQKIGNNKEAGVCFLKYPLLIKCNYKNSKEKTVISNGKTVAIIKKKYKKIYLYPIKSTPLSFLLKKERIINLIRNSEPTKINSELIEFIFIDKKANEVKIFFEKNSLNLKGWETVDAYSNKVIFEIHNLKINNQILDNFFKIPQENDL